MAAPDDASDAANWSGGFYELSLTLGAADDARLDRAVRHLWRAAAVQGPEPRVVLGDHLRGTLTLPTGARVVCGSYASRWEDVDTLLLYLPLGALARTDRRIGGFPFDARSGAESLAWRAAGPLAGRHRARAARRGPVAARPHRLRGRRGPRHRRRPPLGRRPRARRRRHDVSPGEHLSPVSRQASSRWGQRERGPGTGMPASRNLVSNSATSRSAVGVGSSPCWAISMYRVAASLRACRPVTVFSSAGSAR